MSRPETSPVPATRPPGVVAIALILVLEALALLAAAAWYVWGLLTQTPLSYGGAVFTLVLLVVLAVWLLAVGHFLFRGYRWTRSAALVWQLFMVALAVPTLAGGIVLPGILLLLPPAVATVLLFSKPVVAYTSRLAKSSGAI